MLVWFGFGGCRSGFWLLLCWLLYDGFMWLFAIWFAVLLPIVFGVCVWFGLLDVFRCFV